MFVALLSFAQGTSLLVYYFQPNIGAVTRIRFALFCYSVVTRFEPHPKKSWYRDIDSTL